MEWEDLENHIIVCGWNRKAEIIVREAFQARKDDPMPIVVIAKLDGGVPYIEDAALRAHVQFLNDDFTKVAASFGVRGIRVEQPREIAPALAQALAANEPIVVDVVTQLEPRAPEAWSPPR